MRILIAAASCVLLAACSSSDPQPSSTAPSPATTPSSAASSAPPAVSDDPCDLLSAEDLRSLIGDQVGEPTPGLTGGVANCQWTSPDGTYVQMIGANASDWAQSLPEVFRTIESSGPATDSKNLRKLRAGAAMVAAGTVLAPTEACGLFSAMVELQGRPAGTQWTVNVVPTRADPLAVTGQMCSGGRFTSVMVANESGLDDPLPLRQVTRALQSAHRTTLG